MKYTMTLYKKVIIGLTIFSGPIQAYNFNFFKNKRDDQAYYKELLDSVEDKGALDQYRFTPESLYGLLAFCCGQNFGKIKYPHSKDLSLAGIQELERIIEQMKKNNKNDPRLLELIYLYTMAISQKFHEIERF